MKINLNNQTHMNRLNPILDEAWNFLVRLFSMLVLWLTPISNYVNMVWLLLAINFATGLYKSMQVDKQKFSTEKFRKSIAKFVLYALAIIAAFILQQIMNDGTEIAKIIAVVIGSAELVSIYENISKVVGFDLVGTAWEKIKAKIDVYISGLKISTSNKQANDSNP